MKSGRQEAYKRHLERWDLYKYAHDGFDHYLSYELHQSEQQISDLKKENEKLVKCASSLLEKLPHSITHYSGEEWCTGCRAILYSSGKCKDDCIIQKARKTLAEIKKDKE